jgi:hypothetical protein
VNQSQFAEEMLDYAYYKAKKSSKYPLTNDSRCGIMNSQGKGRATRCDSQLGHETSLG